MALVCYESVALIRIKRTRILLRSLVRASWSCITLLSHLRQGYTSKFHWILHNNIIMFPSEVFWLASYNRFAKSSQLPIPDCFEICSICKILVQFVTFRLFFFFLWICLLSIAAVFAFKNLEHQSCFFAWFFGLEDNTVIQNLLPD